MGRDRHPHLEDGGLDGQTKQVSGQQIFTIIVAILGTGAFTALIQGAYGKRKQHADAAQVVNQAAVVILEPLYREIARLEKKVGALERRERELTQTLQMHAAWDYMAVARMREAGVTLEDIPPLYPPARPEYTRREDDPPPLLPRYGIREEDDRKEGS